MAEYSGWHQRIHSEFEDGLAGLGERTISPRIETFEGATYSHVYFRPGYRLASALMSTREVLVIATDFHNLQARTLKYAQDCLRKASGRLEPNVVVVLHQDRFGNARLPEWAKDIGLTVLPVNVWAGLPRGAALEDAICSQLYAHDPFDLSGPVRNVHQFFGRENVPDLTRRLAAGSIQSIFAVRKMGKTSVIARVVEEAQSAYDACVAMVDCSDDAISELDAGRFLYSIGGTLTHALSQPPGSRYSSVLPLAEAVSPPEAATIILNTIETHSGPFILVLDEVDYITPSSPTAPHWRQDFNTLFRAMRRVYQECARRSIPLSILVSGVSSYWFSVESIDGIENSALALVPESYLPPLEDRAAQAMVQDLGKNAGLIFDEECATKVATTCSSLPFWTRKAGSFINSVYPHEGRPIRLELEDVENLCKEFVQVEGEGLAASSLLDLFGKYPELGVSAIRCGDGATLREVTQQHLSALGRYAILGDGFAPSGPMVKAGLEHYKRHVTATGPSKSAAPESPQDLVREGSSSAAAEVEWADLLSEVSVGRNLLERRLRDLTLALLRAEKIAKADQRAPSERLLNILPNDMRSSLARKSADAIIKKFLWSDLVKFVEKEWRLFATVFGDKPKFSLQASIINDRPDSHAKDFDGADLALQRRAIRWMDDRIDASGLL